MWNTLIAINFFNQDSWSKINGKKSAKQYLFISKCSDFEIGNFKILPSRKRGRGPGLVELPKIWSFPFNIYAMAESIDFKFGTKCSDNASANSEGKLEAAERQDL